MSFVYDLDFNKLDDIFQNGNRNDLDEFCQKNNLIIRGGKVFYNGDTNEKVKFWDKRQLVRKILLNSCFGAVSNAHCRFFDIRIGQSTTLTGRSIVKHMISEVNRVFTGKYEHYSDTYRYSDTDSVYFSAYELLKEDIDRGDILWNKDTVTDLYDTACNKVNSSFANFMQQAFHCPLEYAKPIAAGREIVGSSGLFITKKRYAIMVYDNEGKREDVGGKPGKIKAMGLDLRRSDTPVFIQDFLKEILEMVLLRYNEDEILNRIVEYREEFRKLPPWKKGSPKAVNKVTWYKEQLNQGKKLSIPGHVRASWNWNNLRKANSDNYSMEIVDGMKIIVCKLRNNPMGYTSIAYPTDETRLPEWFKELPFDESLMEETILDNKLNNLIGQLGYNISSTNVSNTFNTLFEF